MESLQLPNANVVAPISEYSHGIHKGFKWVIIAQASDLLSSNNDSFLNDYMWVALVIRWICEASSLT